MEPRIIYEDEFILAVDKPSGLLVHADGRRDEATLVDWINANYPGLAEVGEPQILQNLAAQAGVEVIKRPGIVHRLDAETSGVVIIAKTQESFLFVKEQFQNRKVEKIYRAFVWGCFKEGLKEGKIERLIGRDVSDFRKWSAEDSAKGKLREAVTEYKVLKQNKEFAYLEIKPKTGRTHQIRVHMKSISHPVVGDKLYAPKREPALGFERLALHALSIKLKMPSGLTVNIESELPQDFSRAELALA